MSDASLADQQSSNARLIKQRNESTRPNTLLQKKVVLTDWEKHLINNLQGGFPICEEPFEELASRFNRDSCEIQETIKSLLERGVLSRFGPLFNIEHLDGCFSLCALMVPEERFDAVTEIVNAYQEVAHNYARDHEWNMWFVLAAKNRGELNRIFEEILDRTQCPGMNLPKQREFFVGLHFDI